MAKGTAAHCIDHESRLSKLEADNVTMKETLSSLVIGQGETKEALGTVQHTLDNGLSVRVAKHIRKHVSFAVVIVGVFLAVVQIVLQAVM